MKKLTAILVVLCMVIGIMPVVSLAEANTITAVRTGFFNYNGEWKLTDDATGSDNILVSTGTTGWEAASSFTDTDGTTVAQPSLSGTGFLTARHGLVAFEIPEDLNTTKDLKVTLSMTVKNVKQVTSGARLAVYGNSVLGTWSTANAVSTFGVSGSDSGVGKLPLLGLTSAIQTGNQSGESASGETITVSSLALTDYVKEMADAGMKEVTFRLAAPLGGIRLYSYNTSQAPTMTIEEGELSSVNVKTVYYSGEEEVESERVTIGNVFAGSTYTYTDTPTATIVKGQDIYVYSADRSTLSVTVAENGSAEIVIAYEKYTDANSFNGYEIDSEGAWCWFADPRAISYKNEEGTIDVTIIGYIDVHGNIKATQVNNLTDKVDEVLIRTNIQPDDHNNPTFLVLPDERIIVFYSRHTDEACFWYRVTEEPGDITTFGEEKCLLTSANTTYPSPFLLSDDPDNIYLCWRGIEWHPTIAKISIPDENGDMHFTYGPYQMVRSSNVGNNVRPYAKYASNGKDKIYMSYTSTHPDNFENNWLYFNQIDINTMTMQDINGTTMSTIANGPLAVNHTNQSHIVDQSSGVRNWLWQVAIDENGYPVIANVRINGGKTSHDYYYVKWNGEAWVKTFLTNAGGKFHPSDTEYCYSGGMSIDTDNPNVMYCSKPVSGLFGNVYEIFKYTMSSDGSAVLSSEQITQNSVKNNIRPWAIPNSEGDDLRVLWMSGDYDYWMVNSRYPAGYPTAAMANVPLPTEEINPDYAFAGEEDYEELGGVFVSTNETANIVEPDEVPLHVFTVSADVFFNGDYYGQILDLGNVQLSVKNLLTRYADNETASRPRLVLTVDGVDYASPNVYGTSDEWKNQNVQTGGEYFFTKYDRYVNLTVTYDGEWVTVYRDGLLDIKEKLANVESVEAVEVGGFDGYVENVAMYSDALDHNGLELITANEYTVTDPGTEGGEEVTVNYVSYLGEDYLASAGEPIKPAETVILPPGTDVFNFAAEDNLIIDGVVYMLEKSVFYNNSMSAYAVYSKGAATGENLVQDGFFEDENGNFSWGTWQSPSTGNYFSDTCEDWFYKVNRDTNAAALYQSGSLTAADYALGTRWNDGVAGLCSMANFIPVEAGKTYLVSYDYKNKTENASGATIRTTFQRSKTFTPDDSTNNNTPVSVTTDWQTNTFAITAPADGYIYFHFYWLGSGNNTNTSSNTGSGPYWYFDNFEVSEVEREIISARITKLNSLETRVMVENISGSDITGLNVYAASYDEEGAVLEAAVKKVDIAVEDLSTVVYFELGGNVKVFFWDENMKPVHDAIESQATTENVNNPEAAVMVVDKVSKILVAGKTTYRLKGVIEGDTISVDVNPDEYENTDVKQGNIILYSTVGGFASDINLLFESTKDAPADAVATGFENILSEEYSDENVTIHYGTIEDFSSENVTIGGYEYNFASDCNIAVVDYSYANVSIEAGAKTDAKPSTKYTKTAFVKTAADSENEITDIVVFIME